MPEHGSPAPSRTTARIIALINQKGGVGKTTTTVNLAAALAASGCPTLIVDLDPQAHASLSLGVDPAQASRTVYDLLLDWDDEASGAVVEVRPNLSVIASETDLAAAEAELAQQPDRHKRLARALEPLKGRFGAILIDCPPSLGMLTINALAAAGEVIIPMQAHFLALQGVGKLLETVKLVRAKINPDLLVAGAIICMHDPSATHTQEVVADIDAFFTQARGKDLPWSNAQVFRPAIRRNIKLAECPSFGQTIFDYAPQAPGAADYRALAEAIFAAGARPSAPTVTASAAGERGKPARVLVSKPVSTAPVHTAPAVAAAPSRVVPSASAPNPGASPAKATTGAVAPPRNAPAPAKLSESKQTKTVAAAPPVSPPVVEPQKPAAPAKRPKPVEPESRAAAAKAVSPEAPKPAVVVPARSPEPAR